MFKNARRKLSGWGRGLLSSLGLIAAVASSPSGGRYVRHRDLLPKEVQQARIDAAIVKRSLKQLKSAHDHNWARMRNPIYTGW